jgi:aerobic-type carbon monoxide dehydrogenase small subunit (CoxS/CutS family)
VNLTAVHQRRMSSAVDRGRPVLLVVDGREVLAYEGESVAAALLATGQRALRNAPRRAEPRGMYCGIGLCFECAVTVDGQPGVRACLTPVRDGLAVTTAAGAG